MNFNLYFYNQEDLIKPNLLDASQYISKSSSSNSYGINIQSIYNNFWESTFYFNLFSYSYGEKQYSSYQENYIQSSKIKIIYYPIKYIDKVSFSMSFSNGNNTSYMPHINYGISTTSEFIENLMLSISFNHFITINNTQSDTFLKAHLSYNIL